MIIAGVEIKHDFLFETVKLTAEENGITDVNVIVNSYEELYNNTVAKRKSWNCKMIEEILQKNNRRLLWNMQ